MVQIRLDQLYTVSTLSPANGIWQSLSMNDNSVQALSAKKAAALLGIGLRTFYRHLRLGALRLKRRRRGGRVVYLLREVEREAERSWSLSHKGGKP